MKSKPPSKKIKLEPPPPPTSLERPARNVSPSGSTTSNASSLLSIPPPTSSTSKSADLVAAAKAVASGVKSAQTGAKTSSVPTYPTYIHHDITEWPRINVLINSKGGEGKTSTTLGQEGAVTGEASTNMTTTDGWMSNIDALQAELETLWSATACRIRSLKIDQTSIQNSSTTVNVAAVLGEHFDPHHQEKINAVASLIDVGHGTRTSVSAAAKLVMCSQQVPSPSTSTPPPTTVVSKKTAAAAARQDKLPKKKLKGEPGSATKKGNEKPARSTQNRSHSVSSDFGGFDSFYKHEAPNEFWEFADNYCGEVISENLEELSKVIDEHSVVVPDSLFEVPPLGTHFRDGENPVKIKSEPKAKKRIDACGPLTQRLVSALVDERISMYNNHKNHGLGSPREDNGTGSHSHELGFVHRAGLIKALGLDGGPNRPPMETQLRECLMDRGLLHPDDANATDPILANPDDEILGEIRKTQNTLKRLHNYNADRLKDLKEKAQREMERSTFKVDLDKADKDVIEAYKSIASLKQKKKPVSKKEKDSALKALENRDKALQKLNPSIKSEPVGLDAILKIEI